MNHIWDNVITMINAKGDHAWVGGTLIAAGFIPMSFFSNETLQAVYFCVLIPPAAYHCYLWTKKHFFPTVIKVVEPVLEKVIVPVIVTVLPPKVKKTLYARLKGLFEERKE